MTRIDEEFAAIRVYAMTKRWNKASFTAIEDKCQDDRDKQQCNENTNWQDSSQDASDGQLLLSCYSVDKTSSDAPQ